MPPPLPAVELGTAHQNRIFGKDLTFHYHDQIQGYHTIIGGHDVVVMVPREAEYEPDRRFPAVYMLDGEKLFEANGSAPLTTRWKIGKSCRALIDQGAMEPIIIVAVFNGSHPDARIADMTPSPHPEYHQAGHAVNFATFLFRQLMPAINTTYPTQPQRAGVIGASLGGLFSAFAKTQYPDVLDRIGILSPSLWIDTNNRVLTGFEYLPPTGRIFMVAGQEESPDMKERTSRFYHNLRYNGWDVADCFPNALDPLGRHHEVSWGAQVKLAFQYLYPSS